MARRRRQEDPSNHERWMVSYADFITLLFAFFVVMYSISSVNEGKYKILSDALDGIFNQQERSIKLIPVGDERVRGIDGGNSDFDEQQERDPLDLIAESIEGEFANLLGDGQLHIRANEMWMELELSSSLLFPSADAIPHQEAFDIIEKIALILAPYDNPIQVEGFTDNLPINTRAYPTNWELSAARAATIVRMLAMEGVKPTRLAAVGYGEFQPVASNETAQGRAKNRRVVLIISRNTEGRHEPVFDRRSSTPKQ